MSRTSAHPSPLEMPRVDHDDELDCPNASPPVRTRYRALSRASTSSVETLCRRFISGQSKFHRARLEIARTPQKPALGDSLKSPTPLAFLTCLHERSRHLYNSTSPGHRPRHPAIGGPLRASLHRTADREYG